MYKVEIFDENMSFVSACLTGAGRRIELDYISYSAFTLDVLQLNAKKGYFVHITKDNETVADGIISNIQPTETGLSISIRPLQAMFDTDVFTTSITNVISWLEQQITENFISNPDRLQNRPIDIVSTLSANSMALATTGETTNILKVISQALTTYAVVCRCYIDMSTKRIAVRIYQETATKTLEADLENVISKKITLGDSYGAANKITIRQKVTKDNADSYPLSAVYYLHPDGTVDRNNSNRITPVFPVYKNLRFSDTWQDDALALAVETLAPKQYDNEIILTYKADDKIARPTELAIGTKTTLIINGVAYSSLMTGIAVTGSLYELIFGQVRVSLTKQLIMQRS